MHTQGQRPAPRRLGRAASPLGAALAGACVLAAALAGLPGCQAGPDPDAASGPPAVTFHPRDVVSRARPGGGVDVHVDGKNVTNFTVARQVLTATTSPDGRRLLVWHQTDATSADRVADVYDLRSGDRLVRFEPHGRGRLAWATDELITHRYLRAGGAAGLAVYEDTGVPRWERSGGGILVDPSGQIAVRMPALDEPGDFAAYDLASGRALAQASADDVGESLGYQWLDDQTLRAAYLDPDGQPRAIQLTLEDE